MRSPLASAIPLGFVLLLKPVFAANNEPAPPRQPVVWSNPDRLKGDRITHHELESAVMARTVGYTLYLPSDYDVTGNDTRYPVVYFLHGAGGNESRLFVCPRSGTSAP